MKDRGFVVLSIAMDSPDAARPFIEQARPTYPCLIDRDHHVAGLYDMVNVPEAVWIDERGRVVRPAENAGWYEGFRRRNRVTGEMPEDAAALVRLAKDTYMAAVRDWAVSGDASRHVADAEAARRRLKRPTEQSALAHAHFRLARVLERSGRADAARRHFDEASRLHPDSWNIWRQSAPRYENGFASGPGFWARVDALGARRYYPKVDIDGMP